MKRLRHGKSRQRLTRRASARHFSARTAQPGTSEAGSGLRALDLAAMDRDNGGRAGALARRRSGPRQFSVFRRDTWGVPMTKSITAPGLVTQLR